MTGYAFAKANSGMIREWEAKYREVLEIARQSEIRLADQVVNLPRSRRRRTNSTASWPHSGSTGESEARHGEAVIEGIGDSNAGHAPASTKTASPWHIRAHRGWCRAHANCNGCAAKGGRANGTQHRRTHPRSDPENRAEAGRVFSMCVI